MQMPALLIWSMKRLCAVIAIVAMVPLMAAARTGSQLPPHAQDRILVKFKVSAGQRALSGFLARQQVRGIRQFPATGIARVDLEPGTDVADAVFRLEQDPAVEYAEPDYLLRAQQLPDDPYFGRQWYLRNTGQMVNGYVGRPEADIKAVPAWEKAGDNGRVVVAVVDSGVDLAHPDLVANLWTNPGEIPGNGLDDDGNGKVDDVHGWDFVDGDNQPQDATGHGTHVAGIIAAESDNGQGIAGVASNVRIMALRFIDGYDLGATSDAIAAIEYALANGARVINCSWGGPYYSRALHDTMARADALFVCAAGNGSANIDVQPFYPAGFGGENLLAVAATTAQDTLAWFSNRGAQTVDLAAPGFNIFSARPGRKLLWSENFSSRDLDGWEAGGSPGVWSVTGNDSDIGLAGVLAHSPRGNYGPGNNTWIATEVFDLTAAVATRLTFHLLGASQSGHDFLFVEGTADGKIWLPLRLKAGSGPPVVTISGTLPYWTPVTVDLGRFDGAPYFRLRFHFVSDEDTQDKGWYLDTMELSAASAVSGGYCYMHGTSMAAAVVSGAAAMAAGRNSVLSPAELKLLLTGGVDRLESLHKIVRSGGRLNLDTAVYLAGSVILNSRPVSQRQIDLSWVINTDVATDLTIERYSREQNAFISIARVAPDAGSFPDTGLAPGTTYIYRVRTVTKEGKQAVSNQAMATTPRTAGSGGGGGCFVTVVAR